MKMKSYILSLMILVNFPCFSQDVSLGKPHTSFFQNYKTGNYNGTVNGLMIITKPKEDTVILDFQAGKALIDIEHDPEEMYDVSTKNFVGFTTSGKTQVTYLTYAGANEFHIYLNNQRYVGGLIDGAADLVISGMDYYYFEESTMAYTTLYFNSPVICHNEKNNDENHIVILQGSTLTFAIKTTH